MKKSKYTDAQILSILKQGEAGTPVPELCREHGMSSASFYKWRARYGGMDASMMSRLKELESENSRLKKMYAEEKLKAEIIKEAMEKGEAEFDPVKRTAIYKKGIDRVNEMHYILPISSVPVVHVHSKDAKLSVNQLSAGETYISDFEWN